MGQNPDGSGWEKWSTNVMRIRIVSPEGSEREDLDGSGWANRTAHIFNFAVGADPDSESGRIWIGKYGWTRMGET